MLYGTSAATGIDALNELNPHVNAATGPVNSTNGCMYKGASVSVTTLGTYLGNGAQHDLHIGSVWVTVLVMVCLCLTCSVWRQSN